MYLKYCDRITKQLLSEIPRIRCSALVGSIVEVLSNKYLCKTFSPVYIEILRKNMFPFRSYWGAFSEDNWNGNLIMKTCMNYSVNLCF